MDFDRYVELCVVTILKPSRGDPSQWPVAGTGFWVLPDGFCLTCYHVLRGIPDQANGIRVRYGDDLLELKLCQDLSLPDEDIAVLKLEKPSGVTIRVLPVGLAQLDREVRIYGYRADIVGYYRLTGRLRPGQTLREGEVLNLETSMPSGVTLQGMSGAPVYDQERGVVVGIQVSEEKQGPSVVYIHPIEKIYRSWPDLQKSNAATLIAKLRWWLNDTQLALDQEFRRVPFAMPYKERQLDRDLADALRDQRDLNQLCPGWVIVGDAGIGKSTLLCHLAEWCRNTGHFLPVWLRREWLFNGGQKLSELLECEPNDWGKRLQTFQEFAGKPLVVFVDGLDLVLPQANAAELISQLDKLASNAILLCSSRPSEFEQLSEAGELLVKKMQLEQLSMDQVSEIMREATNDRLRAENVHPDLVEMCRNPFVLYLLLDLYHTGSFTSGLAADRSWRPTITWVMERYWKSRVESVRGDAFEDGRFNHLSKEDVGRLKAALTSKIADQMLITYSYSLDADTVDQILDGSVLAEVTSAWTEHAARVQRSAYQELIAEGVVRVKGNVSFMHDMFAEFVICRYMLLNQAETAVVQRVLDNLGSRFYVTIAVRLVHQARDCGKVDIEHAIYAGMIKTLLRKRENQTWMNRAWGVTYALRELASMWSARLCATLDEGGSELGLDERGSELTASSIASILHNVGDAEITVPALARGLQHYPFRKRFVEALGTYRHPRALRTLIGFLETLLNTRTDDELLETVALALEHIGDLAAVPLLARMEAEPRVPLSGRRAARAALWSLAHRSEYSQAIPYSEEELLDGLRLHDQRDPSRYSDWKMVKCTAEIIEQEVRRGLSVSPRLAQALLSALDHEHEDAQHAVVKALGSVAFDSAADRLIAKMEESETPDATRAQIAHTLAHIAKRNPAMAAVQSRIRAALSRVALADSNPRIRRTVEDVLATLRAS